MKQFLNLPRKRSAKWQWNGLFASMFLSFLFTGFSTVVQSQSCAGNFTIEASRSYDEGTNKTTFTYKITKTGAQNGLSHFSMPLQCDPPTPGLDISQILIGAVAQKSNDGINWTGATSSYGLDNSQSCVTGPVFKFDEAATGNVVWFRLIINGNWQLSPAFGVVKYGNNCCIIDVQGGKCLTESCVPLNPGTLSGNTVCAPATGTISLSSAPSGAKYQLKNTNGTPSTADDSNVGAAKDGNNGILEWTGLVAGTYYVSVYREPVDDCSTITNEATIVINSPSSSSQEKTICSSELPYMWDGLEFTEAGTKEKTGLTNAVGCDSTATFTLYVNPTTSSSQEMTICVGQLPYMWDGLQFTEAGTKQKTGLVNQYGCDSTATFTLYVNPNTSSSQEMTICVGQLPYTWDGLQFTEAGTKQKTGLVNQYGCDSTATFTLYVNPNTSSSQEKTICSNLLPYTWDGLEFTEAGTKQKTGLVNQYGCDSTATFTLYVNPTTSSSQEKTICSNLLPYTWDGLEFTEAGTKQKTGLVNQYGCDSTATFTLYVNPTTSSSQEMTICVGQLPYMWDGLQFTEAGTKQKTGLVNQYGCDSTATFTLYVNPNTSSSQEMTICVGQLPYTWDGLEFTEAGTKQKTGLVNQYGCDSTATFTLYVNPNTSSSQEKTICSNLLPYTWDGLEFTEAGSKQKTGLVNQYGCDSTATFTLYVNPTTSSSQEMTICVGQLPYMWDGLQFTEAGVKQKTGLVNQYGCDSTATFTLYVNPNTSSSQEKTICSNQLPYTWDGLEFTEAGVKQKTGLVNQYGCDSTATFTLYVNPTTSSSQEKTICSNLLPYTWDGLEFTEAGTKQKTGLVNQYGCDSTASYTLYVNPLPTVTADDAKVCIDATVQLTGLPAGGTWSGAHVDANGLFNATGLAAGPYVVTYSYTDANGCTNSDEATVTVEDCNVLYCSYTQGYFGNKGGNACTPDGPSTTLNLITNSIGNMPNDKLYLGLPGHSFTVLQADAAKIMDLLPGGGKSVVLGGDYNWMSVPKKGKKINNTLLAQTITLALNVYMPGSDLGSFSLANGAGKWMITRDNGGSCAVPEPADCVFEPVYTEGIITGYTLVTNPYQGWQLPANVINALAGDKTVMDLLQLASDALGGAPLPAGVTLEAIADAAAAMNEGFDECRYFVKFADTNEGLCVAPDLPITMAVAAPSEANSGRRPSGTEPVQVSKLTITTYPNPFVDQLNFRFVSPVSGRATLEVINMYGQRLGVVFDGQVKAGVQNFVNYRNAPALSGMLMYKLTVGDQTVVGKVQSIK